MSATHFEKWIGAVFGNQATLITRLVTGATLEWITHACAETIVFADPQYP